MLPSFYPLDLLHVFDSSPEFVSWLLTLHFPLAALAAYALGRARGMSQPGAFACGTVYSVGGFALSTLNLYIFLQAPPPPLVGGALRGTSGVSPLAWRLL